MQILLTEQARRQMDKKGADVLSVAMKQSFG